MMILLIFFFSANAVFAQWGDYWPAFKNPRKANSQMTDIVNALNERVEAKQLSNGTNIVNGSYSLTWWRSARSSLQYIKNHFISINDFVISADDEVPINYVVFTMTSLCEAAKVPTNFFEYTPWRGVNGLGVWTNDIDGVGHPHGWTNEWTANGGTNFPSGRSCWYTTDYGFDAMKDILSKMKYLVYRDGYYNWITMTNAFPNIEATNYVDYLDAQSEIDSKWVQSWESVATMTDTLLAIGQDPSYRLSISKNFWNGSYRVSVDRDKAWKACVLPANYWDRPTAGVGLSKIGFDVHVYFRGLYAIDEWDGFKLGVSNDRWTKLEVFSGTTNGVSLGTLEYGMENKLPSTQLNGTYLVNTMLIIEPDFLYK